MKAVFLDRYGTINDHTTDYVKTWKQFHFLPNALDAIKKLSDSSYKLIVVTNQTAVRRDLMSLEDLEKIHEHMLSEVEAYGATIDGIYVCNHLPEDDCGCRKPKTGLVMLARDNFDLDLSESWFVGDNTKDIKCGIDSGCKTILVETGWGGKDGLYDVKPTHIVSDIGEAADIILDSDI